MSGAGNDSFWWVQTGVEASCIPRIPRITWEAQTQNDADICKAIGRTGDVAIGSAGQRTPSHDRLISQSKLSAPSYLRESSETACPQGRVNDARSIVSLCFNKFTAFKGRPGVRTQRSPRPRGIQLPQRRLGFPSVVICEGVYISAAPCAH